MDTQQPRDSLELPTTYQLHLSVDFKQNRTFFAALQGIFVAVVLISLAFALILDLPLASSWSPLVTIPATLFSLLVYMAVHEATHGITLQLLTGHRPAYSVNFPFLVTSSPLHLTRRTLITVALTPAIIWGMLFSAALFLVPTDARLTLYILLTLNFAGSAGDYLETVLALRQPRKALLKDEGDSVQIFLPTGQERR